MGFTPVDQRPRKSVSKLLCTARSGKSPGRKNRRFYAVDHGSLRSIIDWQMSYGDCQSLLAGWLADMDPEAGIVAATISAYLPDLDLAGSIYAGARKSNRKSSRSFESGWPPAARLEAAFYTVCTFGRQTQPMPNARQTMAVNSIL